MRLLVLGANGQVGSEMERAFASTCNSNNVEVEVLTASRKDLDLSDLHKVKPFLKSAAPDFVVNAAAYTAVDQAETDKELAFAINSDAVKEIAHYCRDAGSSLLHISTDYVFDGSSDEPYAELDEVGPTGVYGQSKLAGEQVIRESVSRHIILRTAWVFGTQGNNFVKTMLRLAKTNSELSIVADQVGAPTSSKAIAFSIVDMVLTMGRAEVDDKRWGTYHFSGLPYVSWADFANEIFHQAMELEIIGSRPKVNCIETSEYPTPAARPANSRLNCSKIQSSFGIAPDEWKNSVGLMLQELNVGTQHST